jgi:hypothetical protein
MKKSNKAVIDKLKKDEAILEKSKKKGFKEVKLEQKISKLTGKTYKGKR